MTPLAVLPMYDRPELRQATDRLWAAIRDRLRDAGIAAPDALDREIPPFEAWTDPALVLGQTCGLPYMQHLSERVLLLGAPDYGVVGCPPGHYCSTLVVRADDAREDLADFAGSTAAINETGSQSGYAALMHAMAPFAANGRFFGAAITTGAHRASAQAVAKGRADIAAIDAVTWRFIELFDTFATSLRVLAATDPTPALPLITGTGRDPRPIRAAIGDAIASLDAGTRQTLGLRGLIRLTHDDYTPLLDRLAAAEARHRLPSGPQFLAPGQK